MTFRKNINSHIIFEESERKSQANKKFTLLKYDGCEQRKNNCDRFKPDFHGEHVASNFFCAIDSIFLFQISQPFVLLCNFHLCSQNSKMRTCVWKLLSEIEHANQF